MNNEKSLEAVKGIFALLLLLIYLCLLGYMIIKVVTFDRVSPDALEINSEVTFFITTIGALISAVVIGLLGNAESFSTPGKKMRETITPGESKFLKGVVWGYIGVWCIAGLITLIVGVFIYPDVNNTLHEIGRSWFGILLGSAYVYFGINPA
jgi:ABC-type polysaccharide/polyol phosphate export permease